MQEDNFDNKPRVLVAVTGSVAAIRVTEFIKELLHHYEVKLILTESSKKFVRKQQLQELSVLLHVECLQDEDEQVRWAKRGDPVLHIQLRKWADALVIAPLSANTLAKIASGICDNLVTLVCRCWDMKTRPIDNQQQNGQKYLEKPIIVAPAMNTLMWEHPITSQQLQKVRKWGYTIVNPVQKVLVCGDQGKGAMAQLSTIALALKGQLSLASK